MANCHPKWYIFSMSGVLWGLIIFGKAYSNPIFIMMDVIYVTKSGVMFKKDDFCYKQMEKVPGGEQDFEKTARGGKRMEKQGCSCAPVNEDELYPKIEEFIARHRGNKNSLIMVLHKAQSLFGYLPRRVQEMVAEGLDVPLSEVYGVASFYAFFTFRPRGRHGIALCNGTACYVKGSAAVKVRLEQELGIKAGDTTPDRRFSLDVVRCIGCCALAPVMTVDEDVHAGVEPEKVPEILEQYK